jgi:ABC-type transport system involved in cytochrome c biogenesis permease subunit
MSHIDITLFWIGFWLYLASFILFAIHAAAGWRRAGVIASVLFTGGLAMHTAGLAARWVITTHPPFSTMYEYAVTMSWVIALSFVFFLAKFRRMTAGVIVSPVLIVVLVIASLLPKEASKQLMPALQSYWFYIHVSIAAISEGAFLVAAGAGVFHLLRRTDEGGRLPPRELLEEIISRSIRFGYPLFFIGALFAGAVWASSAWGRFWSWDPKETGALVIWLYYTLVLHQDIRGAWTGRRLAIASIVGLAIILFSFLGNLFLGGLHAYI